MEGVVPPGECGLLSKGSNIPRCFTICFTICLCISPDFDGNKAPKMNGGLTRPAPCFPPQSSRVKRAGARVLDKWMRKGIAQWFDHWKSEHIWIKSFRKLCFNALVRDELHSLLHTLSPCFFCLLRCIDSVFFACFMNRSRAGPYMNSFLAPEKVLTAQQSVTTKILCANVCIFDVQHTIR